MALTIGRCGLTVELDEPTSGTDTGDQVALTGVITGDTLAEVVANLAILRSYIPRPGQAPRTLPVTIDEFPTWDGFYRLLSATVTADADSIGILRLPFTATLSPVRRKHLPPIEARVSAGLRANAHSIAAGDTLVVSGLPPAAVLVDAGTNIANIHTRPSAVGNLRIVEYSNTPPDTVDTTWRCAPGSYLVGAARFESPEGTDTVGVQVDADVDDWLLTNDVVRIGPGSTDPTLAVACWDDAWESEVEVQVGWWTGSAWSQVSTRESIDVVRESPEETVVRVGYSYTGTSYTERADVTLSIRRGSRLVVGSIVGPSSRRWGVASTQTGAWQDDTSGASKASADADFNQLCVFTPHANTVDTTNRRIYLDSGSTRFDFGIGHVVDGGSGDLDGLADLRAQYFARQSEMVEIP